MSFVPTRVPAAPRRPGTVVVTVDGVLLRGRALDVRGRGVGREQMLAAVNRASTPAPSPRSPPALRVACDPATPVHGHVRAIPPRSFDLSAALVAAARSRGVVPDAAGALERARRAFVAASCDLTEIGHTAAKRRVAEAGRDERRLDERVATLRGRLLARRDVGADTDDVEAALAEAVAALTDVETERIAAEQRLRQVERTARAGRADRQRRLRLADRVDNLRRRARRELVASVYDDFAAAVETLPGDARPGRRPAEYVGDDTTAALAVARLAPLRAPLVLSTARFGSPAEAATRLDAPVIRCRPSTG